MAETKKTAAKKTVATKKAVAAKPRAAKPRAAKAQAKPAAKPAKPAAKPAAPAKRAVARPVTRAVRRAERVRKRPPAAPRRTRESRPLPTAPAGHAPLIATDGSSSGTLALPASLATVAGRAGVVFQALLASRANARQANAATRNRSRVRGGGAKPYRQKGTGRARQGSRRAPQFRHGAVVFGPNGRRYGQRIPEKMRKLAFAEAFATRAAEGRVLVYDVAPAGSNGDRLRTRDLAGWIGGIGETARTLVVASEVEERFGRALSNLPAVALRTPGTLRLDDLLAYDTLLIARAALDTLAARAAAPHEVMA